MGEDKHPSTDALEEKVAALASRLADAKAAVREWVDANSSLSRSAAEARASNQGAGRGLIGGLLGPKFRRVMRAGAAASNAAIAKDVASKRAQIALGKRDAQELVNQIRDELAAAKQELRALRSNAGSRRRARSEVARAANDSLNLLNRLKEARDAGLLTEEEYEEKRRKLASEL